jgi:hypothetical protein
VSPGIGGSGSNLDVTVVTTKRRPAPRAPARKNAGRGAHRVSRGRTASGEPSIFRRHAADLWAIGLITLGVLLALALWGDGLGPVGHKVDTGFAYLLGWTRIIIPLVSAGAGVVLLLERERPEPLRTGLGSLLGVVGFCGIGELANRDPSFSDSQALRAAGGWLGVLVGHPLHAGIGSAGAAVLFVALILVAGLIATGVSLATFGGAIRVGAGAVGSTLASWWNSGLNMHADDEDSDEEYEEEYEEDEPVAKPKRVKVVQTPPPLELVYEEPEIEPAESEPEPDPEPARLPAVIGATPRAGGQWKLPSIDLLSATKQLRPGSWWRCGTSSTRRRPKPPPTRSKSPWVAISPDGQ